MLVLFQYTILRKQKETQICSYFLPCFDKNSTKQINHWAKYGNKQIFNSANSKRRRTVTEEPWFVMNQIMTILEYFKRQLFLLITFAWNSLEETPLKTKEDKQGGAYQS